MKPTRPSMLLVTALVIGSCNDDRDLSLAPADPAAEQERDRLRRLMAVRVIDNGAAGSVTEIDAEDVLAEIASDCAESIRIPDTDCAGYVAPPFNCSDTVCYAEERLCTAHRLLEISGLLGASHHVQTAAHNWDIPSQSTATNVALVAQATLAARDALDRSVQALRTGVELPATGSSGAGACGPDELGDPFRDGTAGRALASTLTEAFHLHRETVDRGVDATLAAGDAQLGSGGSLHRSVARAYSGAALSRAAAAHLLVGGDDGFLGSTLDPLCDAPTHAPPVRTAISVLREAAIDPAWLSLESGLSTGQILASDLPNGSVRQRLGELWNYAPLAGQTDPAAVAAYFGLRIADFDAARSYLGQEVAAFGRSQNAHLAPRILVGDEESSYPRHAATASEPRTPPRSMYPAIARWRSAPSEAPYDHATGVGQVGAATNAADVVDSVLANLAEITEAALVNATIDPAVRTSVLDVLALVAAQGSHERPGRLQVCYARYPATPDTFQLYFFVDSAAARRPLRIVRGEDGLRCAETGTIEGAACDLASLTAANASVATTPWPGFTAAYTTGAPFEASVASVQGGTRFYLAEQREGVSTAGPGTFVGSVGFPVVHQPPASDPSCFFIPELPELEARVAGILAPSQENCTLPAVSCSGESNDARLPLEDSLTEDANASESSWEHYLHLAELAARESDARAEELFQAQLEMDLRAEQAIGALQSRCGASIDPVGIVGDNLAGLWDGTACAGDAACGSAEACVAGRCMGDPLAIVEAAGASVPALNRLQECLGAESTVPYVAVGNRALCIWRRVNDPNRFCEQDPDNPLPCPVLATGEIPAGEDPLNLGAACPDLRMPTISGVALEPLLIRTTLNYFDLNQGPRSEGTTNPPCDQLRELRVSEFDARRERNLREVVGSNFYRLSNVIALAPRLSWEARLGGYSAILVDDRPEYWTGSPAQGPATGTAQWPCASANVSGCASVSAQQSLFCTQTSCTNEDAIARTNVRMLRAVLGAHLLAELYSTHAHESSHEYYPYDPEPRWHLRIPIHPRPALGCFNATAYAQQTGQPAYHSALREMFDMRSYTDYQVPWWGPDSNPGSYFASAYTPGNRFIGWRSPETLLPAASVWPFYADDSLVRNQSCLDFEPGDAFAIGRSRPVSYPRGGSHLLQGMSTVAWPLESSSGYGGGEYSPYYGGWQRPDTWPPDKSWVYQRLAAGASRLPASWHNEPVSFGPSFVEAIFDEEADDPAGTDYRVLLPRMVVNDEMLLDSLELMCALGQSRRPACNPLRPPRVTSVDDLSDARSFLQCVASAIDRRGGLTVFANLPSRAVDALREASSTGAFPSVGGEYGAAVSRLRGALIELSRVSDLTSSEIDAFAEDVNALRIALARSQIRGEMADIQHMLNQFQAMSVCTAASLGSIAGCATSLAQIGFLSSLQELDQQDQDLEQGEIVGGFASAFRGRSEALSRYAERLSTAMEEIDGALADLETVQSEGRRLLNQALFLDSTVGASQFGAGADYRRRLNTRRVRYEDARRNAVRLAFLAKRAIEQRLGMRLSDMTESLPLVAAPASWESRVCASGGASIESITSASTRSFADAYIGDYVRNLRNVVESYRLTNGFQDGADTVVVSLRDDIMGVRSLCEADVSNILYQSGTLDARPQGEVSGWDAEGCGTETVAGETRNLSDCVIAHRLDETESGGPFPTEQPELSTVRGYRIQFGAETVGDCPSSSETCGLRDTTRYVQRVALTPSRYRLSWYGRQVGAGPSPGGSVRIADAAGLAFAASDLQTITGGAGSWSRHFVVFDVTAATTARLEIAPLLSTPMVSQAVDLAAFMLEDVGATVAVPLTSIAAGHAPPIYVDTQSSRRAVLPVCEDTSGVVFRETRWRRHCLVLCSDGYRRDCTESSGETQCFWETSFAISQREIEAGRQFVSSGFARGNYNYRLDRLAVNFVGTGLRSCEGSQLPSTCYAGGFIPYTLLHQGPYSVRDHRGWDFQADLFPGRIEHARGLATERYVTNPLSSGDRAMLEPFTRREWRGRPLDGGFVLRVWEEPGVDFSRIEDVQLVVDYNYWTRAE